MKHLVRWENVVASKKEGGLGVIDLKSFNDCLMAKWFWRFAQPGNKLSDLIKSIYASNTSIMNMEPRQGKSIFVNAVLSKKDLMVPHIFWKLGNGRSIRFWEDIWLGTHKLKDIFPRIYNNALNKNCSVASQGSWSGPIWRWHLLLRERRSIGQEVDRLMEYLSPFKIDHMEDKPAWVLHSSKEFTVNSLFKRTTIRGISFPFCDHVWKTILPAKVKIFLWLLLKDKLQTRGNLILKGWKGECRCVFCLQSVETTKHVFVECNEISKIWEDLAAGGAFNPTTSTTITWDVLLQHFQNSKPNDLINLLLPTVMWIIWRVRNNAIFKDGKLDQKWIKGSCFEFLLFWLRNSKSKGAEKTISSAMTLVASLT